jgi:DNA-binding MarR family transcriptional regulator
MPTTTREVPELLKLDNQLCFSIYAASRAITRAYRPILDRYGLTYPQYLVLLILWETDGLSVNEIGGRLYLDSGTLTPLLKRMESAGYIERRRGKEDERTVEIHLTQRGLALQEEAIHIPESFVSDTHLDLDQAQRTKAMVDQILGKMLECTKDVN